MDKISKHFIQVDIVKFYSLNISHILITYANKIFVQMYLGMGNNIMCNNSFFLRECECNVIKSVVILILYCVNVSSIVSREIM